LVVSKINTAAQIILVTVVLSNLAFPQLEWSQFVSILIYLVTATTFASGAAYVVSWGRNVEKNEDGGS